MRSAVLERPRHSMPFLYALQDDDSTEISDIETTESITSNSLQLGEPEGESNSTLEEVLSAAGLTVSTKANTLTNTPQDKEMEKCDNHYPTAASKKRKTVWEHYARTRSHAPKTNGVPSRQQLQKWERELRAEEQALAAQEQGLINTPNVDQLSRIVEDELRYTFDTGRTANSPNQPQARPPSRRDVSSPSVLPQTEQSLSSTAGTAGFVDTSGMSKVVSHYSYSAFCTITPSPVPAVASFSDTPWAPTKRPERVLPINIDLLNYRARVAQGRKNYTEAVRLWELAVMLDPLDGRGWLGLARHELNSHGGTRSVEKAREIFKAAVRACPFNPYLLQGLGVLEEREGDLPRAMELFKEATKCDPLHTASWIARGRLEKRLRRVPAARDCFQRAVDAEPDSYYAWHCWAMLEAELRNFQDARLLFQRSLDANPRNAATFQAWGNMEARQVRNSRFARIIQYLISKSQRSYHFVSICSLLHAIEAKVRRSNKAFRGWPSRAAT